MAWAPWNQPHGASSSNPRHLSWFNCTGVPAKLRCREALGSPFISFVLLRAEISAAFGASASLVMGKAPFLAPRIPRDPRKTAERPAVDPGTGSQAFHHFSASQLEISAPTERGIRPRRPPELLGQFSPNLGSLGPSHAPAAPAPPPRLRWERSSPFISTGAALRKIPRGSSWTLRPLRTPFGPN